MQFVLTAFDYTDEEAINRRLAMREKHLGGLQALTEAGNFLSGGAILDDTGKMIGSTAHVEFEDRQALDLWVQSDPYVTEKVWDQIDIRKVKMLPGSVAKG